MDTSSSGMNPTSDQHFLLYFIAGMYFAPDLKKERPSKSVLQRRGEGLPQYTSNQLADSRLNVKQVENVYYYVLRNANESVIVKPQLLQLFFRGDLGMSLRDCAMAYPQFDELFPPELHPIVPSKLHNDMFKSIVFVHNPDISSIKPGDIERFKKLTGLQDLRLDKASVLSHSFADCVIKNADLLHYPSVQPLSSVTDSGTPPESIRQFGGSLAFSIHVPNATSQVSNATVSSTSTTSSEEYSDLEPRMIFLPSCPSKEVWNNIIAATKSGFAVTGTAASGKVGPVLGLVDIGESDDSYLFRVSLPGVKRNEREFSCEVENDGKVSIRGVTTTGETTVYRYAQAFEMQSQNLCPSGHFSFSFQLPGSVDPHQFTGTFGTDGILEGIVMKARQNLQN